MAKTRRTYPSEAARMPALKHHSAGPQPGGQENRLQNAPVASTPASPKPVRRDLVVRLIEYLEQDQ